MINFINQNNNYKISKKTTKAVNFFQKMQKQLQPPANCCRICLQQSKPLKKLPCCCKGSLSYMHDGCLNSMLHVKMQNQKQDEADYIQSFESDLNFVKVNCEICLNQIGLERVKKLKFERLSNVKMEIYFVLFGISCLSFFGIKIAIILLEKFKQDCDLPSKVLYLFSYLWILGVILYVMLEPLYSQILVYDFKIKQNVIKNGKIKQEKAKSKQVKKNVYCFSDGQVENNRKDERVIGKISNRLNRSLPKKVRFYQI